jgi:T5SS/PEP-CTERM-associated repeat protein
VAAESTFTATRFFGDGKPLRDLEKPSAFTRRVVVSRSHPWLNDSLIRVALASICRSGLTAVISLGWLAGEARPADRVWTPLAQPNLEYPLDASWFDGSNWSSGVPGATDRAVFNAVNPPPNSPYQIYLGAFDKQIISPPQTIPFAAGTATVSTLDVQNNTWVFDFDPFNAPPNSASGNLTVAGAGNFVVGSQIDGGGLGSATLTVTGAGTLTSNGASLGLDASTSGTLTLSGSATVWNDTGDNGVSVGVSGHGILNINSGAQLNATLLSAAASAGSTGDVAINGGTFSGAAVWGTDGQSSLTITSGTALITGSDVALNADSTATVTVSGANSNVDIAEFLLIGVGGHATATFSGGATVTGQGTTAVGTSAGGNGELTITDNGTTWTNAQQTIVGYGGTGSLTVAAGAVLSSGSTGSPTGSSGVIGAEASGVGAVTITDSGSSWVQDGGLSVGYLGQGTLMVEAGGYVHSASGYVGRFAGAVGHATVTGANSVWSVDGPLLVGSDGSGGGGSGSLVVSDSGAVIIGSELQIGPQGSVDVTGGRALVGSGGLPAAAGTLYVGPDGLLDGLGSVIGHVINDGTLLVSEPGSRIVGALDGMGATQIADGADLTTDQIIQSSLTIGNGSTVTIAPSDANGNSLVGGIGLLSGDRSPSLGPFASLNTDDGAASRPSLFGRAAQESANSVPEPSTILLLALGAIAIAPLTRRRFRR